MVKISVIVPIYNVEKQLSRCLESILKQEENDLEIILVNDGSPDNSGEIAKKYATRYPDKILYFEKEMVDYLMLEILELNIQVENI